MKPRSEKLSCLRRIKNGEKLAESCMHAGGKNSTRKWIIGGLCDYRLFDLRGRLILMEFYSPGQRRVRFLSSVSVKITEKSFSGPGTQKTFPRSEYISLLVYIIFSVCIRHDNSSLLGCILSTILSEFIPATNWTEYLALSLSLFPFALGLSLSLSGYGIHKNDDVDRIFPRDLVVR